MDKRISIKFEHKIKWLASIAACLFVCAGLRAQPNRSDSLFALQDNRFFNPYHTNGNAATIAAGYQPDVGYAYASAGYLTGSFRRPMNPSSSAIYSVATGGSRTINRWHVLGDFRYQKRYDRGVGWASVNDPYEGNPFIWADSSSGNWDRDQVNASVAVATALGTRLRSGLVIDYAIGTGARTNEPKPFYRVRDISLQPGITWRLSASQDVGLSGGVAFSQEENEIGYYSNSNVLLYRLRGFGTFSKSPFVSGERKRKGTMWKGAVHYEKRWKNYQLLVGATVSRKEEEVFEGVARTQTIGYFTGTEAGGKVRLFTGTLDKGKSLDIVYANKQGYADDMIFRAESASFVQHATRASLSFWSSGKTGGGIKQWSFCPSFTYVDYADQATYMQFTASTLGAMVEWNWRTGIGSRHKLQVQPAAGYFGIIDDYFTTRNQQVVIRELVQPDYYYFSTGYWRANCLVQFEISTKPAFPSHLITLMGDMRVTDNAALSKRIFCQLQYSIHF